MSAGSRPAAFPNALRSESRWSMASILKRPPASASRSRFASLPLLRSAIVIPPRLPEESCQIVQAQIHGVIPSETFLQRQRGKFVIAQRDHVAEALLFDQFNGGDAKPSSQNPVEPRRRSASLEVPQDGDTRLVACPSFDFSSQYAADAAQAHMAEGIHRGVLRDLRPQVFGFAPFCHNENTEKLPPFVTVLDALAYLVDTKRYLGHQHHIGAAGQICHSSDPASVSRHHLDDRDSLVCLRGRMQFVTGLHHR